MLTKEQLKNYWVKVDIKGEDDCWNWTACRDGGGRYGGFKYATGKLGQAHRVSAYLAGLIPSIKSISPNDQVLHTCDNPACQNPKHFFIGTHKNNMQDKASKGRQSKLNGVENGQSKLTEEDVLEIRRLYAQGDITQTELAKIYGVTPNLICCIVNRKNWRHV
jgi:hypothetical protein